ncbi:hypothetical protein WJN01_06590 [Flavobacteriaceae bacterium SZ-1-7]|uniref:hypothetical protein n=1 Tax=Tamlana sedimenti TaxID=3134126 RepID=UPI0031252929
MYRLPFIIGLFLMVTSVFAQSPHGEDFKINCNQCHNPSGWEIDIYLMRFDHGKTDFALEGAHAQTDCKACHETLVFKGAPKDCASCHNDVHSMSVGNDCAQCHTTKTWIVDNVQEIHEANGFPLIGAHGGLSCVECHTSETNIRFDRIGNDCISCHRQDFEATQHPNHTESGFSTNCVECHSPLGTGWESDKIANHDFFPLTLGHDIQDCTQCHKTDKFSDADPNCVTCHQADYDGTLNPQHRNNGFPTDCVSCHTTNPGWKPANINHDFFPLTRGHDIQDCKACHITDNFSDADPNCVSCHQTDFDGTTNPNHSTVGFSTDCASCHTTIPGWTPANINHDFFPLTQGHDIQDCTQCHTTGNFADADPNCVSCHQTDYDGTTNPNHTTVGFSTDCVQCHTTIPGWTPANINHDFFPLTLGHDIQDCTQCHTTGNYSDADPNCVMCHQTDYDGATDPNHSLNGFPTDCASCHTTVPGWTPASINHDFFPLTLGHDIQDCTQCHTTGNFADADPNCVSCHQTDYDGATDPNHSINGFPTDCASCHTTAPGWTPASINHDFFPLTQGHDIQDCTQCHTTGNFADADPNCVSCHQTHYDGTTNPNHTTVGFSTDCVQCHTTVPGWTPANINHDFFPLTLGHDIQDCTQCHTTGNYSDADPNCVSCHQTDYDGTTNPNHSLNGFPTDCVSCHTTNPGWTPANINHDFFPLTLGHDIQDCTQCHTTGNFADADPNCVSCHQTDYDGTTNPNHSLNGFPTDCASCHTTNPGWTPANINHDFFPLTMGHDIQDCTQCHTTGNFADADPNCVSCHQTDYEGTTNPNHSANSFPTDCASCHTTNPGWTPANINHDFFPLTLGHDIQDCTQCHKTANYSDADPNCVSCHQTDYDNATNPNHRATGFPTDCVECHTTNPGWTPSTFDHNPYFPIDSQSRHKQPDQWDTCIDCHIDPSNFSVFDCIHCHTRDHNTNQGNQRCYECHPRGRA